MTGSILTSDEAMRLRIIIPVIFLIFGAIWFVFFYYFDISLSGNVSGDDYNVQTHVARLNGSINSWQVSSEQALRLIRQAQGEQVGQAFLLPIAETKYLPVRDFTISEPVLEVRAAALYDVNSSRFLYAHNINKRLPIASITKLMTAIIVVDSLDLDDVYTVSVENVNVDGFGADIYRGERLRGIDLFKIMLIKSSNDAALTFNSEAQKRGIDLIASMNERAQEFGMTNTYFSDPAGLDDDDAFSTVADLIKLVRHAVDYDLISKLLITQVADVTSVDGSINHHLVNTNQLLGQISGIIVGKTGYTDSALGTMVLEVRLEDGENKIISVVLGSNDRFGETKKLVEWGKKAYSWK